MAADDWLSALIRNQYASGGLQNTAPGGQVMGYPAASGAGPNMGYPAAGQGAPMSSAGAPGGAVPNIPITPQMGAQMGGPQPPGPPLFQFGGFHPGNAINPDFFHDLAVTKQKLGGLFGGGPNFPVNSAQLGGDTGGADPLGSSVTMAGGAQAAPAAAPGAQPQHPSSIPYVPSWSQGGPADPSIYGTPQGTPSATPRPARGALANAPLPPKRPKNLGQTGAAAADPASNPRFTTVQYQPTNSARNAPIYTALNLFGRG